MQDWQQGDISSNGIRIHYYRTGVVDEPPLIRVTLTDYGPYLRN